MNDDINDAAWILVNTCQDLRFRGRSLLFSARERELLVERAQLFLAVVARRTPVEVDG